jgi:hypothetical protein
MVVHPFQPTLRTPFAKMGKPYTKENIALRKIMRKISQKFIKEIE